MAFGQGTTGLIVASIIALTSGLAFVICLRELLRELMAATGSAKNRGAIDRVLMRNRDVLLDDERTKTYVVEDSVFEEILMHRESFAMAQHGSANRQRAVTTQEWSDRFSYLLTVSFLGLVALAGFVAGISHF